MLRVLAWVGMFIGTPSAGAYASSRYFTFVDPFLVFFVFSAAALVVAILPCLLDAGSSPSARDG